MQSLELSAGQALRVHGRSVGQISLVRLTQRIDPLAGIISKPMT